MAPKISVVVPVYNAAPYLAQCLDSIVNQTLREIELICVDDGSTDGSLSILERYGERDSRVAILRQGNQYAGVARNNGMRKARGEYVIFWDADDFFDLNALEKMYRRAEATQADIVICDSDAWDNEREEKLRMFGSLVQTYLPRKDVFSMEDMPDTIFQLSCGWPWNKLFRLKFIREKQLAFQEIRTAEDVKFVFPAMATARRISTLPDKLITYRRFVETSLENTRALSWNSTFEAFDALYGELCQHGAIQRVRRSFDNYVVEHAEATVTSFNDFKICLKFFLKFKRETMHTYKLCEHEPSYYLEKGWYEKLQQWNKVSPEEYFIGEHKRLQNELGRLCSYHEDLVIQFENMVQSCEKKSWMFPLGTLPDGCRIILYGAGDVGQDFHKQFQREKSIQLVSWVDKNAEKYQDAELPVREVDILKEKNIYDYIIIAVLKKSIANEIRKSLADVGIPDEKMIWVDLLNNK